MAKCTSHDFERVEIRDRAEVNWVFRKYRPLVFLHLAAESHVDRSNDGPEDVVSTNVWGSFRLLESARDYWRKLGPADRRRFRLVHVAADEIYCSLGEEGYSTQKTAYNPNSLYVATKAASDHFVQGRYHTFDFATILYQGATLEFIDPECCP